MIDIANIPKTELHVHVEALMSIDVLRELVAKYKLSKEQIDKLLESIANGYENIVDFFNNWHFVNGTLKKEEDFEHVVYEYLVSSAQFNTKYVELNLNVLRQLQKGLDIETLLYAIYSAQKQAERSEGIISRTLLSYSRDFSIEEGKKIVDMALKYKDLNVCGIDIAGNEKLKPNANYIEVFDYATKLGVKKTAHAGEGAMQNSIMDAITKMKVSRIGHGVDAVLDDLVIDELVNNNITVEVCASSNVALKVSKDLKNHAAKKLMSRGVNIVINTDDPTLLNLSLNDEYQKVAKAWGLDEADLRNIYRNGVNAAFLSSDEKQSLLMYA